MTKPTSTSSASFDQFLDAMARVLGIKKKRLSKLLFQGQEPRFEQRPPDCRSSHSSDLVVK